MKRILRYIFTFVLFMSLTPLISNADCDYTKIAELSRKASNVNITYDYEIVNHNPNFYVDITNVTNDIYIKSDYYNEKDEVFTSNITRTYIASDITIKYYIYSNDDDCKGTLLLTKYLNIPYYNRYSETKICKNNPKFKYCALWMNTSGLTDDEFSKYFATYHDSNVVIPKKEKNNNTITKILKENYKIIIIVLIGLILIPVLMKWKRSKV